MKISVFYGQDILEKVENAQNLKMWLSVEGRRKKGELKRKKKGIVFTEYLLGAKSTALSISCFFK